ncbi:DUF4883 family protein [Clostridium cellulovorans]|uniref:Lipoprotein n=1 Tax=Clostridium cellulovorans (strain ATCC 35296 / DSM 3052 / OCM 3 / 743B) TaxID=573061 RepID=D9SKC8_CLOC7|nr:DUF4883 family protein [Clostridium cellulovorans]ADL51424.1 hypothetical protein Clocel_1680 [Clostridium cellulovorans 743B]
MMKFKRLLSLCLCLMLVLTGCKNTVVDDKKPSCNYYTNLFIQNMNTNKIKSISVYETNYSKDKVLNTELYYIIKNLFDSLKKENFLDEPMYTPENPVYRYYITFSNDKTFVIDVYNENYLTLYPWDGKYQKDFIDISNAPKSYNLHGLSKYLFPRL